MIPVEEVVGRRGVSAAFPLAIAVEGVVGHDRPTVVVGGEGKVVVAHPLHHGDDLGLEVADRRDEGARAGAERGERGDRVRAAPGGGVELIREVSVQILAAAVGTSSAGKAWSRERDQH
jgi:hypothetical protein